MLSQQANLFQSAFDCLLLHTNILILISQNLKFKNRKIEKHLITDNHAGNIFITEIK